MSKEAIEFIVAVIVVGLSLNLLASAFLELMPEYVFIVVVISSLVTFISCAFLLWTWRARRRKFLAIRRAVANELWGSGTQLLAACLMTDSTAKDFLAMYREQKRGGTKLPQDSFEVGKRNTQDNNVGRISQSIQNATNKI